MNTELDTIDKSLIEDKVVRIIRENMSGPAGMDIGNVGLEKLKPSDETPDAQPDPWQQAGTPSESPWPTPAEGQDHGGYALRKGNGEGKGKFDGTCYGCGEHRHSQ